jgi:hypothetical protein
MSSPSGLIAHRAVVSSFRRFPYALVRPHGVT